MAEEETQEESQEEAGEESAEELESFEDAVAGADTEGAGGGEAEEGLDPLAEEMLKLMEEDQHGGAGGDQEEVDQMMEMEMLKAMEQEGGAGGVAGPGADLHGLAVAPGGRPGAGGIPPNIARLMDVRLTVTIELGRTRKTIEDVMDMGEQSLVELDRSVGDPVDVLVNGKLFARGEVVTVSEYFGVRITELLASVSQL
jgi:flagellar motor switch protein FliN